MNKTSALPKRPAEIALYKKMAIPLEAELKEAVNGRVFIKKAELLRLLGMTKNMATIFLDGIPAYSVGRTSKYRVRDIAYKLTYERMGEVTGV